MHNCKTTRDRFIEQLLDGTDASSSDTVDDLQECNECRDEFEAAKETLRVTSRMMDAARPADEYWPGYHVRLRQKLLTANAPDVVPQKSFWILRFFTASVRLPLPVPAALTLALGVLLFLVVWTPAPVPPPPPLVVEVPVQVPVVQEKEVTRIIYRDRHQRLVSRKSRQVTNTTDESTLARSRKDPNAAGLTGFKPIDEIKLTIIKGGSGNDK